MPITMTICARCACVVTPSNPHDDCRQSARSAITERIADTRIGDRQGEYLDATRQPGGCVALRHFIPGSRPADTVILEADEAARLAAFILRTLRSGERYEITDTGRCALAGGA
jgi:hypothetical protein